jgi:hypothetical protein
MPPAGKSKSTRRGERIDSASSVGSVAGQRKTIVGSFFIPENIKIYDNDILVYQEGIEIISAHQRLPLSGKLESYNKTFNEYWVECLAEINQLNGYSGSINFILFTGNKKAPGSFEGRAVLISEQQSDSGTPDLIEALLEWLPTKISNQLKSRGDVHLYCANNGNGPGPNVFASIVQNESNVPNIRVVLDDDGGGGGGGGKASSSKSSKSHAASGGGGGGGGGGGKASSSKSSKSHAASGGGGGGMLVGYHKDSKHKGQPYCNMWRPDGTPCRSCGPGDVHQCPICGEKSSHFGNECPENPKNKGGGKRRTRRNRKSRRNTRRHKNRRLYHFCDS